ncbi:MAG: response regulator, partial [Caulobacteraceae bacterium]
SGRILVIEDEPLVAIEIEQELKARDFVVVGPASHIESARRLIAEGRFDAALLDANLGGERVDDLAAALTRSGRPFAFLSGYGREALPAAFREAELLSKPFDPERLLATVHGLLSRTGAPSNVTRLQPRA